MGIEAAGPLKYLPRGRGSWCRWLAGQGGGQRVAARGGAGLCSPCAGSARAEWPSPELQAGEVPSQMEVSQGGAYSAGEQETSGCPGRLLVGGKGAGSR